MEKDITQKINAEQMPSFDEDAALILQAQQGTTEAVKELEPILEGSLMKLDEIAKNLSKKNENPDELFKLFLETLRGKDGKTPTKEEITELIKPLIPAPIPGKDGQDGRTPTAEEITELLMPLIPQPIPGKDGRDGKDGEAPSDERLIGLMKPLIPKPVPGEKGKDAVLPSREEFAKMLDGFLSYKSLKDLPDLDALLNKARSLASRDYTLSELTDIAITNPTNGQVLSWDSALGKWKNANAGSGSGDVVGPASSTDNAIVRFDGATGKLIKNSSATLSNTGKGSFAGLNDSTLTASELLATDGSKDLVSLAVATYPSLAEIAHVKGVTSAIQTQLNAKAPTTSPTFATSITGSYLTASELLGTDGSKNIVSLPVATYPSLAELAYVKGVTSALQTQLNAAKTATIVFTFGDGTNVISTGQKKYTRLPFAGTITGWSIIATGTDPTCTIDLWKVASGTSLPTVANTIMGTKPALATGNAVASTTLTGWTTSITANDIMGLNLDAVANATWIQLVVTYTKS